MDLSLESPRLIPGGLLIAFEGIDGSGKSTMAMRAVDDLRQEGYNAVYLREPTDGPYGLQLRTMLVSPEKRNAQFEFELFLKDRIYDVKTNISPIMKAGGIVCIDRYYISSMAYQGALGLDAEFIREENEKVAPVPHLVLYFSLPVEAALDRIHANRPDGTDQFEKKEYLEKVQAEFRRMDFPQMVEIDANADQNTVYSAVKQAIREIVNAPA